MANEATIVELQAGMNATDFTVSDGTGISKGCLLQLTDPRTASASSTSGEVFGGIAAAEKEASDGAVNLAAHQTGIFDLTATEGPAIAVGQRVVLSGANLIKPVGDAGEFSAGHIVGTALEATAAGVTEVIEVDIGNR